jgi:hypothetical protein
MNNLISDLESLGNTVKTQPVVLIFCFWYTIASSVIAPIAFASGDTWGAIDTGVGGFLAALLCILSRMGDRT